LIAGRRSSWLLTLLLCCSSALAIGRDLPVEFSALLQESGLRLAPAPGFETVPAGSDGGTPYEHAIRHSSGALEIRFIVRPLSRIQIEYNDPHNSAPEPNHLFPLLFESLTNQLTIRGGDAPSTTMTEAEAAENFNADWAAVSVFDIDPEYSADYRSAILVAMHRNDRADAYTLLLYNNHEFARPLIDASLSIMTFDPEDE
jgi:hypothetical protein